MMRRRASAPESLLSSSSYPRRMTTCHTNSHHSTRRNISIAISNPHRERFFTQNARSTLTPTSPRSPLYHTTLFLGSPKIDDRDDDHDYSERDKNDCKRDGPDQEDAFEDFTSKKSVAAAKLPSWRQMGHLCLVLVAIIVPWWNYPAIRGECSKLLREIKSLQKMRHRVLTDIELTNTKLRKLQAQATLLEHENSKLYSKLRNIIIQEGSGNVNSLPKQEYYEMENPDYVAAEEVEETLIQKIDHLKDSIKKKSQQHLVNKYGMGPYQVHVQLRSSKRINKKYNIVLDFMSIDKTPHAIHHFLHMVEHEMWVGLSMTHRKRTNASSNLVLQASPLYAENSQFAKDRFENAFPPLAFVEDGSCVMVPHHTTVDDGENNVDETTRLAYAVAFLGQGPQFGIFRQTMKNPEFYENPHDAQEISCFATVSEKESKYVLDNLHSADARGGDDTMEIESMHIVSTNRQQI